MGHETVKKYPFRNCKKVSVRTCPVILQPSVTNVPMVAINLKSVDLKEDLNLTFG